MINFSGPLYKIDNKHSYNEFETQVCSDYQHISLILLSQVDSLKALVGPLYNIDNKHNYNVVMDKVKNLRDLSGPVMDIEQRDHAYREVKQSLDSIKNLTGPFYAIDNTHNYKEVPDRVSGQVNLEGPVYQVFNKHNFNKIADRVSGLKTLEGPCYDIPNKHGYVTDRINAPLTLKYPIQIKLLYENSV